MNFSWQTREERVVRNAYDLVDEVKSREESVKRTLASVTRIMDAKEAEMTKLYCEVKKEAAESKDRIETLSTLIDQLLEKQGELEERLQEVEGIKDDLLNLAELARN